MDTAAPRIITFANIKGGVGKTTAVVNIAYVLARDFSKRVLVVDADDQGNATKALGVRETYDRDTETLWAALSDKLNYKKVMVESPYEGICVIPASKELKSATIAFGQSARGMKMIKRMLRGVGKDFDYVLIDTKPQINILLQAALCASTGYVVPSFPESDSYDGFVDLLTECEEIHEEENDELQCLGVLFTNVKKCPAHDAYLEFVRRHLAKAKIPMFKTMIRHSNAISTGSLHNCPAVSMSTSRNTSDDYMGVTRQIIRVSGTGYRRSLPDLEYLGIAGDEPFVPTVTIAQNQEPELFV